MSTPGWVQDAIFYQIFLDRFADGEAANNPPNLQPWGTTPTIWHFQGGDLRGVIQKMDYLLDLGVNAIYLNPIFQATSNHRYNTTDYFRLDPKLGEMSDFDELIRTAHQNGLKVVLDGVFNHCGRGFFAFNDILENQEHSAYRDWFHIVRYPVDAYSPGASQDYLSWWGIKSLPKFNTANATVRRYLFSIARYWIERGADGWRLDVPNEINDDSFWEEFRHTVKSVNPEAYLVGEIWTADRRWVGETHFDGLLNYPLRDCLIRFLHTGTLNMREFAEKCSALYHFYPKENSLAMYNPLGSHDTERILTKLGGDMQKVKLAFFLQFSFPGAPGIYYGDEIGIPGDKDPDCRRAFPWDKRQWHMDLWQWVKKLVEGRKALPPLRRGDFKPVVAEDGEANLAFARRDGKQTLLVVLNASDKPAEMVIPARQLGWEDGKILLDYLSGDRITVQDQSIRIPIAPWKGIWLM